MACTDSDSDTFVTASAVSIVCPILQNIRQRQESSSTASVSSLVLKKELEGKQRKLFNAEIKFKEDLELYNKWKVELQLKEDDVKLRDVEMKERQERIREQMASGLGRVSILEARKRSLMTEIAEKAKDAEAVDLEYFKTKTLRKTVCKDLGAVAGRMQEISLELSSEISDEENGDVANP